MSQTPRTFTQEFKFNAVMESFIEGNVGATADRIGVHITQLNHWRKQFKIQGPKIFESSKNIKNRERGWEKRVSQLERLVGQLTVQNQLLKKAQSWLS